MSHLEVKSELQGYDATTLRCRVLNPLHPTIDHVFMY